MRPAYFKPRLRKPSISDRLLMILTRNNTDRSLVRALHGTGFRPITVGRGTFRTAYKVLDGYGSEARVIKRVFGDEEFPFGVVRSPYIRIAPRRIVNEWEVQYYYPPCNEEYRDWLANMYADLKPQNVGVDLDGSLVAFDW